METNINVDAIGKRESRTTLSEIYRHIILFSVAFVLGLVIRMFIY